MADFTPQDTTGNHRFTDSNYVGPRVPRRSLILWELPHLGSPQRYLEMYINPQSLAVTNRKMISSKRTKGGFMMQYWGEELETISIDGVTGDGGIEALNAMFDAYRSEQLALVAIAKSRATDSDVFKRRQPLASLAAGVTMWYQGQGKRGYFTDFNSTESVQNIGSFQYRISFVVTETIGTRANFMPWHRKPWSTSETPNLGPGGVTVTGGYAGDTTTRLGPLNSVSGRVVIVTGKDENNRDTATTEYKINKLKDPKYDPDNFGTSSRSYIESITGFSVPEGTGPNQSPINEPIAIKNNPINPSGQTRTAVTDNNVSTGNASVKPAG